MHRTSILIPESLKQSAERAARARGTSLGGLIREQLLLVVSSEDDGTTRDSLFDDFKPFTGRAPKDLAQNHDDYLYGRIE